MDDYKKYYCSKCKLTKPLSEFHSDSGRANGHCPSCKSCRNEQKRKRYTPRKATTKEDLRGLVVRVEKLEIRIDKNFMILVTTNQLLDEVLGKVLEKTK